MTIRRARSGRAILPPILGSGVGIRKSFSCIQFRAARSRPIYTWRQKETAPMKIKSGTRAEKLREAIEESIATGTFAPGMHLEETELAQRFGVSRTPLREALIQLSSMGIVVLRPRRGAVVAEVTPQRLHDAHRGEL